MNMRRFESTRYLSTFALVTLVFVIGIIIGQTLTEMKFGEFSERERDLRAYILSLDLQSELISEKICDVDPFVLTEEKTKLGRDLEYLEDKFGRDNPKLIPLKKEYTLLSIRQWLLVKRMKEECGKDLTIILYFYSNEKNASICESQGYILDYLYHKNPEKIVIYAFDYDLDTPALNTLKSIYNVRRVPSLVINDELYPGFQGKDELETLIFG